MFHVKHSTAVTLVWIACLAILPLPLVGLLDAGLVDSPVGMLVTDLGLIAYVWWLVATALSTRPRWLEKAIGLPSLYFLHGLLGVAALAAAGLHVLWSTTYHRSIRGTGMWAWYIELFSVVYAVLFLSGWLVDRLGWVRKLKNTLGRVLTHEATMWIHRLNLVAVALIAIHVSIIPRVSRLTGFMVVFYLYTAAALGTYLWGKFVAPASPRRQATVIANTPLNGTTRELTFALGPDAALPAPGDFYFVSFQGIPGFSQAAHPFSVSRLDTGNRTVSMTIHASGDLTSRISEAVAGTPVTLEGPFGQFEQEIEAHPGSPLVLIGMGAGIAPLLGIAQAWAGKRPVTVVDVVSKTEDLYYQDAFSALCGVNFRPHLHRLRQNDVNRLVGEASMTGTPASGTAQNADTVAADVAAGDPAGDHTGGVGDAGTKNAATGTTSGSPIGRDAQTRPLFIAVGPAVGVLATQRMLRAAGVPRRDRLDERLTL